MTIETYGALKALCEKAAIERFGSRAFVVRPGLIVGPYDASDRFTYWVRRVAAGGLVLAPGLPYRAVQFIDVRDLGDWIVSAVEARLGGSFNATGPDYRLSFGALLNTCRATLPSDAEFVWASESFLRARGVEPWTQMPLWIPADEAGGWDSVSSARAIKAGLRYRPLRDTILDTWRWDQTRDQAAPLKAGITAEQEAGLIKELQEVTA
jgi:2'-hydroxyisoflavone reductase